MNYDESQEMLKEMLKEMEQDQKQTKFWNPEEGENTIRFLPPLKPLNEVLPYFHHKTHWIDGIPYECLDQSFEDKNGFHKAESCPACKMAKKLFKISEEKSEERDMAYSLSAKDRYVFRIIDRSKPEDDQVNPEFYEVGPSIFKKFYSVVKSGKYGNIVHPIEGRDFIIDRQGSGRRTNYDNSLPDVDKKPIFKDKEKIKEALTKAVEMKYSDLIEFPTYEQINEAVNDFINPGSKKEVDEDEVVTIKKTPSQEKKPTASPSKVVSDDDEVAEPKSNKVSKEDVEDDQINDLLNEFF